MTYAEATKDFLAQKRIAIVGVSRNPGDYTRLIFRKLRAADHEVVPINPHTREIDGVACYPDLRAVPHAVGAVLVTTPEEQSPGIVHECARLGITRVWLHRGIGRGSSSPDAIEVGRADGLTLISAGCPLMFIPSADVAHRCLGWCLRVLGRLPDPVVAAHTGHAAGAGP